MTSRATIRRKTGSGEQDEDNGVEDLGWTVIASAVDFRLGASRGFTPPSRNINVGGVGIQVALRIGHFPSGTDVVDGDYAEVTAGDSAGTVWRITEADPADQQTARRVPLVSVDRPGEWA